MLPWTGPPLATLATLVGYSRVHTGVHYPSDVIVGSICGVTLAATTGIALDQRRGRPQRPHDLGSKTQIGEQR